MLQNSKKKIKKKAYMELVTPPPTMVPSTARIFLAMAYFLYQRPCKNIVNLKRQGN